MQGYAAYSRAQNATTDPRGIEYKLLGQVTSALLKAQEQPGNLGALYDAVLWNQQVWGALLADLMHDDNQLPRELRGKLASLAMWSVRECNAVIDGTGDVEALVEVNRNIMNGLTGQ
jgi:flagellar protein FlaF